MYVWLKMSLWMSDLRNVLAWELLQIILHHFLETPMHHRQNTKRKETHMALHGDMSVKDIVGGRDGVCTNQEPLSCDVVSHHHFVTARQLQLKGVHSQFCLMLGQLSHLPMPRCRLTVCVTSLFDSIVSSSGFLVD